GKADGVPATPERGREMTSRVLLCLAIGGLASAIGADAPARAGEADGALLYRTYCTACHGIGGDGNGLNVPALAVQPRDHTDTREMGTRTDQDLHTAIAQGGPAVGKSVLMPPWQ